MNKRPDNIALFCFMIAGAYFGYLMLTDARFSLLLIPVGVLFIFRNSRLAISVFLSGTVLFLIKNYEFAGNADIPGRMSGADITISGFVYSASENKMNTSLVISADTLNVFDRQYPAVMKFTALVPVKDAVKGDRIKLKGKFREFKEPSNLYEKDMKKFGLINNIYGEIINPKIISFKRENTVWKKFSKMQDGIIEVFERRLSYRAGNFLSAVMLGRRDKLESSVIREFADSGTIHLLAVSGLHVGFLIMLLSMLSSLVNLRGALFIIINSAALLSYAAFTGTGPSVIRAVLMAIILMICKPMKRKMKFIDVIGTAGILCLLYDPNQIFNPGFILSFAAVASIAIIYQPVSEALKKRFATDNYFMKTAGDGVMLSLLVTIGLLPFVLYIFGKYNFVSIISNVVIIPLTGAAFTGGILLLLVDKIDILASFTADIINFFCYFINSIASVTAEAELFTLHYKSGITVTVVLAGVNIIIFYLKNYRYKLGLSIMLIAFLSFQIFNVRNEPAVYLFHTESGGSAVINSCGVNVFIAGKIGTSEINRIINPYMLEKNITELDYLITSEEWYDTEKMISNISIPVKYLVTDKDHSSISGETDLLDLDYINRTVKFPGGAVYVTGDGNFNIITADSTFSSENFFNTDKGIAHKIR